MVDIHKAWKYNNYFSKDKYIQHETKGIMIDAQQTTYTLNI